jgi:hypothetical protein
MPIVMGAMLIGIEGDVVNLKAARELWLTNPSRILFAR